MGLKGGKEERNPFVFFMLHSSLWDFEKIGYDTKARSISFSFNHSNSVKVNCNTHILCHYDSKKLWWKEFFIYKLDFCPLSSLQWRLKRMRPVQQKSPLPPCCQPIVAIVTWTMSTKAQLLWGDGGDGGALHLLMTQFSFQASVLWLFLSFLFGHLCPHFIIDCDGGSNKKSTKNHYSAPMDAPPPPQWANSGSWSNFVWITL